MSTPRFQAPNPADDPDLGFPPKTPVAAMTAEERAEYWRHQSKTQQRRLQAVLVAASTLAAALDDVAPDLDALRGRKTA